MPPTVDVGALGTLALETNFDTSLDTGRAALRDFKLTALGATVSGTLEGVPGDRGDLFRGQIQTSRFAPDAMTQAFAAMLPPTLTADKLGMLELAASFTFDAGADTLSVQPLRAEAFGLRTSGAVAGRDVTRAAAWTGTANVAQFSPQELLQRFGLPPQATSDPQAFTRATVATRFAVTKDGAELDGLVLTLDETTIRGTFALRGFDAPAYRFALNVDAVDADRYLPPKARDAQAGEATAGDIELPQNNTMNLDGTMQVGSLKLAGMQFADVGGRIVIGSGDFAVENARTSLYGGTFAGNFRVHAAGDEPGLALDGRAANIALEPLIAALTASEPNFSGTGSFDLNLAGKGRTITENVQTAGGNVNFEMANGAIKGFNLGRTLCAAYNVTQRAPGPPELPAVTAYEGIKGSAVVVAGAATSNDLLARTSFMDINGAGTLASSSSSSTTSSTRSSRVRSGSPTARPSMRSSAARCRSRFVARSRRRRSCRTSASSFGSSFATRFRTGWRIACAISSAEAALTGGGGSRHAPRFRQLPLAAVGAHEQATAGAQHEIESLRLLERAARRRAPLRPRRRAPLDRQHALARQRVVGQRDGLAVERGRHDARELCAALLRVRGDEGGLLLRT